MTAQPRSILSMVFWPAIVSLVVTILRLVGELQGWNDQFFSNVAPGGEAKPGFVGIGWLIPIFGFWFGLSLRRSTGQPHHSGLAALRTITGIAVLVGGFFLLDKADLISFPDADNPGEPRGLPYMLALAGLSAVVLWTAWPRLMTTLFVYGLLARIPVVAVTWLSLHFDWNTHYSKLPIGMVQPADVSKFQFLALPQVTFWLVITMGAGGLFGCLGAALARQKQ
jgi:hypothetical protein